MIKGFIRKLISITLCFSGTILLSGCYHYFDIPKDEYLRSRDHSEAILVLDTNQEIIINEKEDVRISSAYDSVFVTTDTLNYSIAVNNIVSISQNRIDWIATPLFTLAILVVVLSVIAGTLFRTK